MERTVIAVVLLAASTPVLAEPRSLSDVEWTIEAQGFHAQAIDLPKAAAVLVDLRAVKNAGNGFTIRVVNKASWEAYRSGMFTLKQMRSTADSQKVTSFHARLKLPGPWAFIVENSENASKPIVVHARIVTDPSEQ